MTKNKVQMLIAEAQAYFAAAAKLEAIAPAPIEFREPTVSVDNVFKMFKEAVRTIWKSDTLEKHADFDIKVDNKLKTLAALVYLVLPRDRRRKRAIGDSLIMIPTKKFTLVINEKLLKLPVEQIRKIVIHEAVHIGHPNHDADFERVVRKYHGAVSENDATSDGKIYLMVQPAPRKRYVQVEPKSESTFTDIEVARKAMRKHFDEHKLPVRLSY